MTIKLRSVPQSITVDLDRAIQDHNILRNNILKLIDTLQATESRLSNHGSGCSARSTSSRLSAKSHSSAGSSLREKASEAEAAEVSKQNTTAGERKGSFIGRDES